MNSRPNEEALVISRCRPRGSACEQTYGWWVCPEITMSILRIPPIERAQWFIERVVRLFRLRDKTQRELMHEPRFRARIPRRLDRFLSPLQHALRLRKRARLFRMTRGGKKKNLGFDFLGFQFAALDLGRIAPERGRFDLNHFAHDEPL